MRTAIASQSIKGIFLLLLGGVIGMSIFHFSEGFEHSILMIVSVIVLIVSCLIMQKTIGVFSLRRMTIPGFWYLSYIAIIFIPSVFVFFNEVGPSRYVYLFAVESVLLTVPLGILFVNMVLRFQTVEIDKYFKSSLQEKHISLHLFVVSFVGLLGALGLAIMYVYEVKTIPVFYMISHPGDYERIVLLREESFKLLDSHFRYAYYLLRVLGFPFLIMLTLGFYMVTKKMKWLVLFLSSLGTGLLYASFSIAKMPVFWIILLILLFLYLYRGGHISIRAIVVGSILALLFPLAVILLVSYGTHVDMGIALRAIGQRIFYSPAWVLYFYFELFPGDVGYLYGRSIGLLSRLMGWDYFNTPNYVGLYGVGSRLESVNANAAFIGDLNANFGMIGVLLGGILAGVLMQTIQVHLIRRPKTVLNLVVYAYLMFAFSLLHQTSLPVVLASNGVIVVLFLLLIIRIAVSILRTATAREVMP